MPLLSFLRDERGAVSVDWIVLSAALAGLSLAAVAVVSVGTESRSEGFVVQTEVWRKGEHAVEAYRAHNQESFLAMFGAIGGLAEVDLNGLNAFTNAVRGSEGYDGASEQWQQVFTDLDAAVAAHFAETREIRPGSDIYDDAAVESALTEIDIDTLYSTYGDGAGGTAFVAF